MKLFFGNALWHLIEQSDFMTRMILLMLLGVSIACWSLIFYKLTSYKQKEKQVRESLRIIRRVTNKQEFLELTVQKEATCAGPLFVMYAHEMQLLIKKRDEVREKDLELLELQRTSLVEEIIFQEEAYLPVLSIAAACGPLVGLFGTVWGLTNSFIGISEKQSADIVTIAPGMAEALVATMAGLMVAIPMLIMFHYLQGKVRTLEHLLQQLSDQMQIVVQKTFLETEGMHEAQIIAKEGQARSFVS